MQNIFKNKIPQEVEVLTEKEQFNEMLMIGLRTTWGVSLLKLKNRFSEELIEKFEIELFAKLEEGFLIIENDFLKIPEKHWFLADGIASDLFSV